MNHPGGEAVPCPITADCLFVDLETVTENAESGLSPVRALAGLYGEHELLIPKIRTKRQAREAMERTGRTWRVMPGSWLGITLSPTTGASLRGFFLRRRCSGCDRWTPFTYRHWLAHGARITSL